MSKEHPKRIAFYGQVETKCIAPLFDDENKKMREVQQEWSFQQDLKYKDWSTDKLSPYRLSIHLEEMCNWLSALENMNVDKLIDSDSEWRSTCTNGWELFGCHIKTERSDNPFKIVDIDPFIVINNNSDLFYKGQYLKVIKTYYNIDTEILSCDTDFVEQAELAQNLRSDLLEILANKVTFYNKWVAKYKEAIEEFDEKFTHKDKKEETNVTINADTVVIKKNHDSWFKRMW